jgi:hypothetical protein
MKRSRNRSEKNLAGNVRRHVHALTSAYNTDLFDAMTADPAFFRPEFGGLPPDEVRALDAAISPRSGRRYEHLRQWAELLLRECLSIFASRVTNCRLGTVHIRFLPLWNLTSTTQIWPNGDQIIAIDDLLLSTLTLFNRAVIYGCVDSPSTTGRQNIVSAAYNFAGAMFPFLMLLDKNFCPVRESYMKAGTNHGGYQMDKDKEDLSMSITEAQVVFIILHELAHKRCADIHGVVFERQDDGRLRCLSDDDIEVLSDMIATELFVEFVRTHDVETVKGGDVALYRVSLVAPCLLLFYYGLFNDIVVELAPDIPGKSLPDQKIVPWRHKLMTDRVREESADSMCLYDVFDQQFAPRATAFIDDIIQDYRQRERPAANRF